MSNCLFLEKPITLAIFQDPGSLVFFLNIVLLSLFKDRFCLQSIPVQCFCFTGYNQSGSVTLQYQSSVSVLQAITSLVQSHYGISLVFLFYRL